MCDEDWVCYNVCAMEDWVCVEVCDVEEEFMTSVIMNRMIDVTGVLS